MIKKFNRLNAILIKNISLKFPLSKPSLSWFKVTQPKIKWYRSLNNISLSVPKGKIHGIVGKNGSGKSSLLRAIAGVYKLSKGEIKIIGANTSMLELGKYGSLFISGRKYILRWLKLNGVPKEKWESLIDEIREFSELGKRLDDKIYTYSAGMATRLYFSVATLLRYDVYLIDEILSVGDEHFQAKCWVRIRNLLSRGASGILVTHDWPSIIRLCENTSEISNGKIIKNDKSEIVIRNYIKNLNTDLVKGVASFIKIKKKNISLKSGQPWEYSIPVIIKENKSTWVSFTVEKLIEGQGWQVVFNGNDKLVSSKIGKYNVNISVDHIPLNSGIYRLNLFLTGNYNKDKKTKKVFDVLSWINGNNINLNIHNDKNNKGLCNFKYEYFLR